MSSLPYLSAPGNIDKAFSNIKAAAVPDRVSQDFVKTILKIPGGSGDQMTSFLKKIGLANSDGTPNERYRRFRNPSSSGQAVAECIRDAYEPLYIRNEYTHKLADDELLGLIVEETGQAHDSKSAKLIFSCIKHLKEYADFELESSLSSETAAQLPSPHASKKDTAPQNQYTDSIGLNLGYTINLNLPATSDPAVFDAIFKSLRTHLLSTEDA